MTGTQLPLPPWKSIRDHLRRWRPPVNLRARRRPGHALLEQLVVSHSLARAAMLAATGTAVDQRDFIAVVDALTDPQGCTDREEDDRLVERALAAINATAPDRETVNATALSSRKPARFVVSYTATLSSLATGIDWAYALSDAALAAPHRARSPIEDASCAVARELVRVDVAALGLEADPLQIERVLRARGALRALSREGSGSLWAAIVHAYRCWADRDSASCRDVTASLSAHAWATLRACAADVTNAERLEAGRPLPYWRCAWTKDPADALNRRETASLRAHIEAVCRAFDSTESGRTAKPVVAARIEARYAEALAALPTVLLQDHAGAVLSAHGALPARTRALWTELGSRDGTIDTLLHCVSRGDSRWIIESFVRDYFLRFTESSAKNRRETTLRLTRWLFENERADGGRAAFVLARQIPWKSLWPRGARQPWIELLIELGSTRSNRVVGVVIDALGARALPRALRVELLDAWVSADPARAVLVEQIAIDKIADPQPARARRALVERCLRDRGSRDALRWALLQSTGPLHDERRQRSLAAHIHALCEDDELRAAVLRDRELVLRFYEPLRETLRAGALTERAALATVVTAAWEIAGNPDWSAVAARGPKGYERARAPFDSARAARRACYSDDATCAPLSEAEWTVIRATRGRCLAGGSALSPDDFQLFRAGVWDELDRRDFTMLATQVIEASARSRYDLLACVLVSQWNEAFEPLAHALLAAIDEDPDAYAYRVWTEALAALVGERWE